jgi:hypothetical protein
MQTSESEPSSAPSTARSDSSNSASFGFRGGCVPGEDGGRENESSPNPLSCMEVLEDIIDVDQNSHDGFWDTSDEDAFLETKNKLMQKVRKVTVVHVGRYRQPDSDAYASDEVEAEVKKDEEAEEKRRKRSEEQYSQDSLEPGGVLEEEEEEDILCWEDGSTSPELQSEGATDQVAGSIGSRLFIAIVWKFSNNIIILASGPEQSHAGTFIDISKLSKLARCIASS